jgi:anthranilate synthase component 1
MYFLRFANGLDIVGSSPEALVKVNQRDVLVHPIAGTRKRSDNPDLDKKIGEELLSDPKERAEHLMLVDLGRNDLGRVCEAGSVAVVQFMQIERYSHVMHIVSTVTGKLSKDKSAIDALYAVFPAGTLSGAPKPSAMKIIESLEEVRRGIYGGTIGYIDFNGNLDTCIAIRTAIIKDGKAYVQAGAGVVADSIPESENQECLNKAAAVLGAIASANAMAKL